MKEPNEKITFSFGQNWQRFADFLDPERVRIATESLTGFLERPDLKGMSFLDIGCGSGLFSLSAYLLNASRITSVDVDPYSVETTRRLHAAADFPKNWTVLHGSILDQSFTTRLQPADVVYAWGSLHHTGRMWDAIRKAATLVNRGGVFFVAIYNKVEGRGSSEYWLRVKRLYNRCPILAKRLIEITYVLRYHVGPDLIRLRNPFSMARDYKSRRGMSFWIDVRDWLGGYPYEFASAGEIFKFCHCELGLTLINLHTVSGLGLNEFLFQTRSDSDVS